MKKLYAVLAREEVTIIGTEEESKQYYLNSSDDIFFFYKDASGVLFAHHYHPMFVKPFKTLKEAQNWSNRINGYDKGSPLQIILEYTEDLDNNKFIPQNLFLKKQPARWRKSIIVYNDDNEQSNFSEECILDWCVKFGPLSYPSELVLN